MDLTNPILILMNPKIPELPKTVQLWLVPKRNGFYSNRIYILRNLKIPEIEIFSGRCVTIVPLGASHFRVIWSENSRFVLLSRTFLLYHAPLIENTIRLSIRESVQNEETIARITNYIALKRTITVREVTRSKRGAKKQKRGKRKAELCAFHAGTDEQRHKKGWLFEESSLFIPRALSHIWMARQNVIWRDTLLICQPLSQAQKNENWKEFFLERFLEP